MFNNLIAIVVFSFLSQYSWFTPSTAGLDTFEQDRASLGVSIPSEVETD